MSSSCTKYHKILVTCFGSTEVSTFSRSFYKAYSTIQAISNLPSSLSVLSGTCQQKLKKDGMGLPLFVEDLQSSLRSISSGKILVIPLLLEDGVEYRKIIDSTACLDSNQSVTVLPPLLQNSTYLANAIDAFYKPVNQRCYILVAHGSRIADNSGFDMLSNTLQQLGRRDITCITLYGNHTSSFPEAQEAILVPFFLSCGHHWNDEKESIVRKLSNQYSNVTCLERGIIDTGLLDSLWEEIL